MVFHFATRKTAEATRTRRWFQRVLIGGVVLGFATPEAFINGQTLRVGDELDGYRVTEITHDRVTVSDGTQTFQLLIVP